MTDKPKLPQHHKELSKCCNAPVDMYSGFARTIDCYCNACKKMCFVYDNRYKLPEKIDIEDVECVWKVWEGDRKVDYNGTNEVVKDLADKINAIISYIEDREHGE